MSEAVDTLINLVSTGDRDSIVRFIAQGTDVNLISENSEVNALYVAIENEQTEIVELLLNLGADSGLVIRGLTPLQHAVEIKCISAVDDAGELDDLKIIDLLVKSGADIGATGKIGLSPLDMVNRYKFNSINAILMEGK